MEDAGEIVEAVKAFNVAWRSGDADTIVNMLSRGSDVVMGGPGEFPVTTDREMIVNSVRAFVPASAGPDGGKAYLTNIVANRAGDIGWAYAEGHLDLPGKGKHIFRSTFVFRREDGAWRWVQSCAYFGVPMALVGTETLGFLGG